MIPSINDMIQAEIPRLSAGQLILPLSSEYLNTILNEEDLMVITTDRNLVKIHLLCGRDSINEIWLIVRQYRRWMGVLGY